MLTQSVAVVRKMEDAVAGSKPILFIATGTSTECSMTTNVTATKVSGHFTCPKVTGYNQADRSMGDVAIEIEFEANS